MYTAIIMKTTNVKLQTDIQRQRERERVKREKRANKRANVVQAFSERRTITRRQLPTFQHELIPVIPTHAL